MGKILAICISEKRGGAKRPVSQAVMKEDMGIEGDAHAGRWHRQVSLLSSERIEEFRRGGPELLPGAFGENLVTSGLDLRQLEVGSRLQIGFAVLELTQIGKECHDRCAIYEALGDCIMPREGVFGRVLRGGRIRVGDEIRPLPPDANRRFTAAVITLSDRAAAGIYEDRSGAEIERILTENQYEVIERLLLSDDAGRLKRELIRLADQRRADVVFTSGGTGFSRRDVTPEATEEVCERMAPGIAAALLMKSLEITPRAMLSRQTAGIRKKTLIVNLPGSPKACRENLDVILPALKHGLGVLRGTEDG